MLVSKIKPCESKCTWSVQWNCEWLIKSWVMAPEEPFLKEFYHIFHCGSLTTLCWGNSSLNSFRYLHLWSDHFFQKCNLHGDSRFSFLIYLKNGKKCKLYKKNLRYVLRSQKIQQWLKKKCFSWSYLCLVCWIFFTKYESSVNTKKEIKKERNWLWD